MNPNIDDLFNKHKLEHKTHMHVLTTFDKKNKNWKFAGYICRVCDQTLRTEYLANKHICTPGKVRKYNFRELEEDSIKTVSGQPFKYIDFNH